MKHRLIPIVVLALSLIACDLFGVPAQGTVKTVSDGQRFELREGESAAMSRDGTLLTFDEVSADSRCPIEADCVTAGEVTIRVRLKEGGRTTDIELTLHPGDEYTSADGQFASVVLYAVSPYPSVDNPPDAPYTATFALLGPECCAAP